MSLDFTSLKPTGIQKSDWKMFQHNLAAKAIEAAEGYVESNYYSLGSLYGLASVSLKAAGLWNVYERQKAIHQIGKDTYPDFQDLHVLTRPEVVTGVKALTTIVPYVEDFAWTHLRGFGSGRDFILDGVEFAGTAVNKANLGLQAVNIGATARRSVSGVKDAFGSLSSSPKDSLLKGTVHFVNIYRLVSEFGGNRYFCG